MQQLDGDVSNPCLRVVRLSGELLEVPLTRHEANKIVSVRDLKRCLAKNDTMICRTPGTPFSVYWVRLSHMDACMAGMELLDYDPVHAEIWKCLEQGSLQYMLADVSLLAPEELPAIDDLTFSYENLEELLDRKLLIGYAFKLCKHGGQAWCETVSLFGLQPC